MSVGPCSGVSPAGSSGVGGAAREHSSTRNKRGPSGPPTSGKDPGYKPVVKSQGGQRESDGVVVPLIGVRNAPGGKGPDFGRAGGGGTREGMTGTARSNHPGGQSRPVELHRLSPVGQVQQLQRKLWAAAKQSEGRRFHALFDRICRVDVLAEAWKRVRANRGAAGVDRVTLAEVEEYGVDRLLAELRADLLRGDYHPLPVRRVLIPKPDGGWRFLVAARSCSRPISGTSSVRSTRTSCWSRSSGAYRIGGC